MHSFIHVPEYPVAICQVCHIGVSVEGIGGHLSGSKHQNVPKDERRRIMDTFRGIPGIIQDEKGLQEFPFPPPTTKAISLLGDAKTDGLRCKQCSYISRHRHQIQEHCRVQHQWENPRKRGREPRQKRQARGTGEIDIPWVSNVPCQRFFSQGYGSRWFEVDRVEDQEVEESGEKVPEPGQIMMERVQKITRKWLGRVKAKTKQTIERCDQSLEPNLWLRRVKWVEHLASFDRSRLIGSIQPIHPTDEPVLSSMWQSFVRIWNAAQEVVTFGSVPQAALFEVNRKQREVKPSKPFDGVMEPETVKKYQEVWRQMLCYMYRTSDWDDEDRPPYELTMAQGNAFDAWVEKLSQPVDSPAEEEIQAWQRRVDRIGLELCIALLDHPLTRSEYKSVMISGLAVMGMRVDDGWLSAEDYTPKYSAVIKGARMLVVYHADVEEQEEMAVSRRRMSESEARTRTQGIFTRVQRHVQRYMTLVGQDGTPSPMDWIYESRSYGFKIRYTTTAEGTIDWVGERVSYKKIQFDMTQLRDMVHGLVEEAQQQLIGLMMIPQNHDGEYNETRIPRADVARLEDDCSEEKVGWSFLDDPRNRWSVDGKQWLLGRICQEATLRERWERPGAREDENPYRAEAVRAYQHQIERFQEKLLMLFHMVGGQPPRAPEIIGMRHCNTINGGMRNIFIHYGLVCFVAAYHKNYRSSEQVKIIHRYLPPVISELFVRYLWLVVPFWQQIQIVVQEADTISPFVWSDMVVTKEQDPPSVQPTPEPHEDEGYASGPPTFDFRTKHRSKQWTSERLRKILQAHSQKWLDEAINISAWRQIAIAIANQYMRGDFKDSGTGEIDMDTFDEEEDDPWDLQAGHGTHVAGMIYARLLRQERSSTMSRQAKFRQISERWHRFLGFGESVKWGGVKRKREEFEEEAQQMQAQRFARAAQINIHRQVQAMMGATAQLHRHQEPVIRAIMDGESPIVQVVGCGGGKSLSFMLPAYCSPGGVTIVIAPLVTLKEDLQRRCQELQIDSTIWNSRRPHRTAQIIFVTPESAVSKTFRTFVTRLETTCKLDRVVVDEAHYVLDCGPRFRPQVRTLGRVLAGWCTQLVYLTATLPPRDEAEFFQVMRIPRPQLRMFRVSTSRRNIAYRVQTCDPAVQQDEVCEVIHRKLQEYPAPGKIIVYSGRITPGEELAAALGCDMYHRHVDDPVGKQQRMKAWIEGQHRVIVATNALGLGVDIPDIRVVVHLGRPRRLRDYAQESGRAGRDREASEAIIVCPTPAVPRRGGWIDPQTVDIDEFVHEDQCRRIIMDRVMDGRDDRQRCEEGEERCDVCRRDDEMPARLTSPVWSNDEHSQQDAFPDSGIGLSQSSPCPTAAARQVGFQRQQHQRQWQRTQLYNEQREEATEVDEFGQQLERWGPVCPLCRMQGQDRHDHVLEGCPHPDIQDVLHKVQELQGQMHHPQKERFAPMSCCFTCGVPQSMCHRWRPKEGQGGYVQDRQGQCQYPHIIVRVVAVILRAGSDETRGEVHRWWQEESVDVTDVEAQMKWFGQKDDWGGIEASRLCRVFHRLVCIAERQLEDRIE